jgi:hypothetical protein
MNIISAYIMLKYLNCTSANYILAAEYILEYGTLIFGVELLFQAMSYYIAPPTLINTIAPLIHSIQSMLENCEISQQVYK